MSRTYQVLRWYSPLHDAIVSRISMADDNHQELFMVVPDSSARRAEKSAAVEAITEAIDAGCEPGEVRVSPVVWSELVERARQEQRVMT